MIIENVPINSVYLYPENPREIDVSQFKKLKKSIKEFGFVEPLVVNFRKDSSFKEKEKIPTIVGGNMRWRAAKELGFKEISIVKVNFNKQKEAMLNIALNRISGKWDISKLEKMVYDLSDKDLDLDLDLTGLEEWEQKLYNPGLDSDELQDVWDGMPEFGKKLPFDAYKTVIIHFENQNDVDKFKKLIKQEITKKTKSLWYPKKEKENVKAVKVIT